MTSSKMASHRRFAASRSFFNLDESEDLNSLLNDIDSEYESTLSRDPELNLSEPRTLESEEFYR